MIGWADTSRHIGFDVCSDYHCQRYQGIQELHPDSIDSIRMTQSEVLVSKEGRILDTRFSKCCGGKTELFETCWQPVKVSGLESFEDP